MKTYERFNDAVQFEIITPLGEYTAQHDVDAIIDELIISSGTEAAPQFYVDPDADFWAVVASHAL